MQRQFFSQHHTSLDSNENQSQQNITFARRIFGSFAEIDHVRVFIFHIFNDGTLRNFNCLTYKKMGNTLGSAVAVTSNKSLLQQFKKIFVCLGYDNLHNILNPCKS